jgi:hypothetical protein
MRRLRPMLAVIAWLGSVLLSGCPIGPPPQTPGESHGDSVP